MYQSKQKILDNIWKEFIDSLGEIGFDKDLKDYLNSIKFLVDLLDGDDYLLEIDKENTLL